MSLHTRSLTCAVLLTTWLAIFIAGVAHNFQQLVWASVGVGQVGLTSWLDYRQEVRTRRLLLPEEPAGDVRRIR